MGIEFGGNPIVYTCHVCGKGILKHVYEGYDRCPYCGTLFSKHPYSDYPRRFRRIFNNFMMSKTGDDTIDGMNWSSDMRSYGMHEVFEKAGIQLPSFGMAKEVFIKYRYVSETRGEEGIR